MWDNSEQFLKLTTVNLQVILQEGRSGEGTFVEKILFKNQSFKQVWKCLDLFENNPYLRAVVQGPPGVGKSHACWAVSCSWARSGHTVVYAFMQGIHFAAIVVLKGDSIISMTCDACDVRKGLKLIKEKFPHALLVVDGVRETTKDLLLLQHGAWVLVTSSGMRFNTNEEETISPESVIVDSWTFNDYREAISNQDDAGHGPVKINDNILKEDAIFFGLDQTSEDFVDAWLKEKYFFSGGSVRYMFVFTAFKVKQSIETAFTHQVNIPQLLGNEDSAAHTNIGALRQCRKGKYFLLSQYVMRLLVERKEVTKQIIDILKEQADDMDNNAFKGWIHELDMLTTLKQCVESASGTKTFKLTLRGEDKASEELLLKFQAANFFNNPSDIVQDLNSERVLLLPRKFNQGCYDAAVALLKSSKEDKGVLLVLQATLQDKHSFKQEYLTSLLLQLASNTIAYEQSSGEQSSGGSAYAEQKVKKPKTKKNSNKVLQLEPEKAALVPGHLAGLKIWHCFILETEDQVEEFTFPWPDLVGIQSHHQQNWSIKPTFWKAVLTKVE